MARGGGFFFFTLITGPRRSLRLKLSDTRVSEPPTRVRLGTTVHFCEVVVLKLRAGGGGGLLSGFVAQGTGLFFPNRAQTRWDRPLSLGLGLGIMVWVEDWRNLSAPPGLQTQEVSTCSSLSSSSLLREKEASLSSFSLLRFSGRRTSLHLLSLFSSSTSSLLISPLSPLSPPPPLLSLLYLFLRILISSVSSLLPLLLLIIILFSPPLPLPAPQLFPLIFIYFNAEPRKIETDLELPTSPQSGSKLCFSVLSICIGGRRILTTCGTHQGTRERQVAPTVKAGGPFPAG